MKITELKVHVLTSALAEPFAFSQGWVRQRSATLVEVLTDEGLVGWGEAFPQGLEPPQIAAAAIVHRVASGDRLHRPATTADRVVIETAARVAAGDRAPELAARWNDECRRWADNRRESARRFAARTLDEGWIPTGAGAGGAAGRPVGHLGRPLHQPARARVVQHGQAVGDGVVAGRALPDPKVGPLHLETAVDRAAADVLRPEQFVNPRFGLVAMEGTATAAACACHHARGRPLVGQLLARHLAHRSP